MKELYEFIFKRKSTRKYDLAPLDETTLAKIIEFAENLKPLYPDITVSYDLKTQKDVGGMFCIPAPHYFTIYSQSSLDGSYTNVGFMFQQLDLFLASLGLGSIWLGLTKPKTMPDNGLDFIITLGFGKAKDTPYRELDGFNRKTLAQISQGTDERLECARLAPSATNSQNWFFVAADNKIHVYCLKLGAVKERMYGNMNKIDMGIAIAHLYIAGLNFGKPFAYVSDDTAKANPPSGYYYIGTVE